VHSGPRSIAVVVAVTLLVAGFALTSCGGDGGDTTETTQTETTTTDTTTEEQPPGATVVRVRVVGGVPKGGIVRKTVKQGDRVLLVVTSDVADEVHLHGYDISRDVLAGGTARIRFRAKVPGRFEVELEQRGVQIADLTVEP
jgi:hypothetical protein